MDKILWDLEVRTDHLISPRKPDLVIINKKKRPCRTVDFAVLVNHRMKIEEKEMKDMYLDLARELGKLRKMRVTMIPIGRIATVLKVLERGLGGLEIKGRIESIQTTSLLRPTRILRRVLKT